MNEVTNNHWGYIYADETGIEVLAWIRPDLNLDRNYYIWFGLIVVKLMIHRRGIYEGDG